MIEKIKKNIKSSRIYNIKNYKYFVYPYKGITPINSEEIKYLSNIIASKIPKDTDLIFSVEVDGIFTALPVAILLGKPLVIARSFDYRMPKSFHFTQKTGYYERQLYFNFDPQKVKKVSIVDCILSTGGTIRSAINLFNKMGIQVEGIYTVINKVDYFDIKLLSQIKSRFFSIFDVKIEGKNIIVVKSKFNNE